MFVDNISNMVLETINLFAFAKVNIHLKVFPKRKDGFHSIESIFQRISIADCISVCKMPEDYQCSVESPLMPLPQENTFTKVWELFCNAVSIRQGVRVCVLKNIPAGSGLGGGSSDAASFLCALNSLFKTRLPFCSLHELAVQVGSDVPFFLTDSACLVRGRGEVLTPIQARTDCFGILIFPDVHVVTAAVYGLLDKSGIEDAVELPQEVLAEQYYRPFNKWCFTNDFEQIVRQIYKPVDRAYNDIYAAGADFVQMSGTGSSVFGLFQTEQGMRSAFSILAQKWRWCKPFMLLA